MLKEKRILAGIAILLFNQLTMAATITGNLPITATVINNCILGTISPVAFGDYDPTSVTPNNNTGSIETTCTAGAVYNIGLDEGTFAGATVTTRRMTGPTVSGLSYSLYQDTGRTTNWGNTIGTDTVEQTGTNLSQITTVYGQIPASQAVSAGSYTDTVGIVVTF